MKSGITAFFFCLLIIGVAVWVSHKPSTLQASDPQIVNKTQAFQVLNLKLNLGGDAYILTLQNGYSKNINGYSIGVGASKLDVELTNGERVIAPGDTTQETIPVSNLRSASDPNQPLNSISILAVMFDDATSDGDYKAITSLKQRRAGVKLQLQRINAILESTLASSGDITPDTLNKIESQISELSVEAPAGQSPIIKSGLKSAKEDLISELGKLKRNNSGLKEGLKRIKDKVQRKEARL
ncbi:MAG TPA: hypothetical protein VJS44_00750 [Pyrinomonadaceae bacterium]|nr:hypothetical protein [Pyrinomonadaceae bacterium]